MTGEDLFTKLKKVGRLTPELEEALIQEYGYRGEKALRLAKKRRVLEIEGKTYVWGDHGIYQSEEGRCSCPAGYRVVNKGIVPRHPEFHGKPYIPRLRRNECSHSIASQIARAIKKVVRVPEGSSIEDYLLCGNR